MVFETKPQTLADRVRAELSYAGRNWAHHVLNGFMRNHETDLMLRNVPPEDRSALVMMRATIAALFGSEKG